MKLVDLRTVLKDPIFLAGTAFSLSVLVFAGWILFRPVPATRLPAPQVPTRLHCPACGEEVPYDASLLGQPCQSCDSGEGYVVSTPSDANSARKGRSVVFLVLASLLVEGAIFLAVGRYRHHSRSASREANRRLVWRCPFCRMKFSYTVSQIGSGHRCSRCKTAFALPGPDEPD